MEARGAGFREWYSYFRLSIHQLMLATLVFATLARCWTVETQELQISPLSTNFSDDEYSTIVVCKCDPIAFSDQLSKSHLVGASASAVASTGTGAPAPEPSAR